MISRSKRFWALRWFLVVWGRSCCSLQRCRLWPLLLLSSAISVRAVETSVKCKFSEVCVDSDALRCVRGRVEFLDLLKGDCGESV